jgi:fatty-acid desaturase
MSVVASNRLDPAWSVIIYIATIHLLAGLAFFPNNFSWKAVGIAFLLYWIVGGLGITLGFHRLVAHRSFEVPKWLEYFFVICGTLACQGGPLYWIGGHRIHHKYSDTKEDPHDSNRGFWWSHIGWLLFKNSSLREKIPHYIKDINEEPFYQFCEQFFIPIQIILGLFLYVLGGWSFVIWGIFVRLVVVFHFTWFVNSATHKFGYQSYESKDNSKNCWWVALLTFGEGWHNNHHTYQYSARHGWQWWEVDLTWMTIRVLQFFRLAKNIKLVSSTKS